MGLFKTKVDTTEIAPTEDRLGSTGPLPTGLYNATITNAYVDTYASGAAYIAFSFTLEDGRKFSERTIIASGNEKGNLPYYVDKNGSKQFLPGYVTARDILMLSDEVDINTVETEDKVVEVWDATAGKQVPKSMPVITEVIGKDIKLGLVKFMEDDYKVPTNSRENTQIDKVFHAEYGVTLVEAEAGIQEPSFMNAWSEQNPTDRVVDKRKVSKAGAQAAATAGVMSPTAQVAPATGSLFGKK